MENVELNISPRTKFLPPGKVSTDETFMSFPRKLTAKGNGKRRVLVIKDLPSPTQNSLSLSLYNAVEVGLTEVICSCQFTPGRKSSCHFSGLNFGNLRAQGRSRLITSVSLISKMTDDECRTWNRTFMQDWHICSYYSIETTSAILYIYILIYTYIYVIAIIIK